MAAPRIIVTGRDNWRHPAEATRHDARLRGKITLHRRAAQRASHRLSILAIASGAGLLASMLWRLL